MAIKVVISREFKPETIKNAYQLLMELRSLATLQVGYVSGETMVSADTPNKLVVISSWTTRNRWDDWHNNAKRLEYAAKLANLLQAPETTEVFFVGDKIPEWVDMA